MRVTVDTNLVVSAFLWGGNPSRVLATARAGVIDIYTTRTLLAELTEVLSRDKFEQRLLAVNSSVSKIVEEYESLADVVEADEIEPVIIRDPDDDAVLACAAASQSEVIVSGDRDLLDLGSYKGIRILKAVELLSEIGVE